MERPLDDLRDPMHGRIEDVLVGGRGGCVDSGLRAAVLMVPILTPLRSPVETEYRFCNLAAADRLGGAPWLSRSCSLARCLRLDRLCGGLLEASQRFLVVLGNEVGSSALRLPSLRNRSAQVCEAPPEVDRGSAVQIDRCRRAFFPGLSAACRR